MKKVLGCVLLMVGCGGPDYESKAGEMDPIEAGRYDITLTVTETGCDYLVSEEYVWRFFEKATGGLYVYVEGIRLDSSDGNYFYGSFVVPSEPCDVDIGIHSTVEKTPNGFKGDVMVDVSIGGGFCGNCADYADIVGVKQ